MEMGKSQACSRNRVQVGMIGNREQRRSDIRGGVVLEEAVGLAEALRADTSQRLACRHLTFVSQQHIHHPTHSLTYWHIVKASETEN